jgi:hypothetical protein
MSSTLLVALFVVFAFALTFGLAEWIIRRRAVSGRNDRPTIP